MDICGKKEIDFGEIKDNIKLIEFYNKMRKYGNHPHISFRLLSEASGCSAGTIMKYVKLLETIK